MFLKNVAVDAPKANVTQRKFSLLFFVQLGYLVIYPYAGHTIALRVFSIIVTALSVYAVSFRRSFVIIALLLAIPAIVQRLLLPRVNAGALPAINTILAFAFDVFIVIVIFRRVFMKDEPTTEAIFGSLCIYLLVGFSFGRLYDMLATAQPKAFYLDPAINSHAVPDRLDLIYYSFTTITCLGAAGITPASPQARSMTVLESLIGILYIAVLISRLLTAYHSRVQSENAHSSKSSHSPF